MILSENLDNYFSGFYAVSENNPYFSDPKFISGLEKRFLLDFLGASAFLEFQNDIQNGLPTSEKWIDFVNGIIYEYENEQIIYEGILEMLQGFIFYKLYQISNTQQGNFENIDLKYKNALALSLSKNENENFKRWNKAVNFQKKAMEFLLIKNENSIKQTASNIADNLNDTYTITSNAQILGLLNFSRVKMSDNLDYTVSNITAIDFQITAETGKIFENNFSFFLYNNLRLTSFAEKQQIRY